MKTVAVIEGFAGGPMHTKKFRQALREAGFKVIKDHRQADIVIAHSAGIYAISPEAKALLLMLIGPTYWPGQRLLKRAIRHARSSKAHHVAQFGWPSFIWKKTLEVYYFFRRHKYLWLGIMNNNSLDRLRRVADKPGRTTLILRNSEDPYTTPEIRKRFSHSQVKFIDLAGVHDDFATNPQPYIDLLIKELE